jgi:glycosyltransferase involved in cell wall biosynthesis
MAPASGPRPQPAEDTAAVIASQDILILSTQDWDALPTRKHHWSRAFAARGHRVLYVEQQMHWLGWLYDLRRQWRRAWRWLRGPRPAPEAPGVWVFTLPIVLPFFQMWAPLNRANNLALAPILRWALRRLGFRRPILWAYTPHSADFAGRLGERLLVYECVDEFSAAKGLVLPRAIASLERRLLAAADVVIVTAPRLLATKRGLTREIHLIPNGVDVEHFGRAARAGAAVPAELARLPRPVIGFIGWIQYWVDFDLIAYAARQRPGWSFVLIGPVEPLARVDRVRGLGNVHFLGRQPYARMPDYVAGFDVCMNPYVMDEVAESVSPLKLYEYLASGKPVVSVDMPEARQFADHLVLTRTPAEFVAGLERALAETGDRQAAARRQAAVAGHSWAARFAAVEQVLAARLHLQHDSPAGAGSAEGAPAAGAGVGARRLS